MILFDIILDLLYPPRCCFCRKITDGEMICSMCDTKLPYTHDNSKQTKFSHVSAAVSPLFYTDTVRDSVIRYKFHSATGYSKVYGQLIAKCIDENGINCDIITYVPLSRKRHWVRGYNQAELIAQEISKIKGIPVVQLLKKIRNNPAQSGVKSPQKRKANVKNVYKAINLEYIKGKDILIIDDVITTGATISECAKMLKEQGSGEIFAASLARSKE